jgi:hypothetical protein
MPPLLAPLLLMISAAQFSDPAEPEQRRIAKEMLEQLLAEDSNLGGSRDYRGRDHVSISGRPRGSQRPGLCERDILRMERASKEEKRPEGGSTLLEVKTERWFYVLADAKEQPRWELAYEPLDRECVKLHPHHHRWFSAASVDTAVSAVAGLAALKAELGRPGSSKIEASCRWMGRCPDFAELAKLIDPLQPSGAWQFHGSDCPQDRWCVDVLLDNPGCGGWSAQLRMDRTGIRQFRSARIGNFVGALHCGEMEVEREMEAREAQPKG